MGIAILSGILSEPPQTPTASTPRLPTRFFACVRTDLSVARVRSSLSEYLSSVTIVQNDNQRAVKLADIVLVACKPYALAEILEPEGIREGLKGKLLISIVAGFTAGKIEEILRGNASKEKWEAQDEERCHIVCAMPNTAASLRSSMTIINEPTSPLPEITSELVIWIFSQIGSVKFVPAHHMNVATVLCAAGPAFAALFIQALASSAKARGVEEKAAIEMTARTMKGMAELVLNGEHPEVLRRKVTTPGGVTAEGLRVLEEGGMKELVAKAVDKSIEKLERADF